MYGVWNDLVNFIEIARINRPEFENGHAMAWSKMEPKIGGSKRTWSCNGKHICIACIPCHLCGDVLSMHALTCSLHACMVHTCIIYACTSYACIIHVCVSSSCTRNASIHAFMHACMHACTRWLYIHIVPCMQRTRLRYRRMHRTSHHARIQIMFAYLTT